MLDHDELLPEEHAFPDLVQELRTTYQMKTEEKQVLTRVHERLERSSQPLPMLEPVQVGGHTQPQQIVPPLSLPSRPTSIRQGWLPRLNMFAAVLFVGLLVGSLVFAFSIISHTRVGSPPVGPTNSIQVLLVPAERGGTPSQAKMEATRTILSQRFTSFGLQGSSVRVLMANGQPSILVELPHFGGNEQQTIATLLETGVLEFWDTGQTPLAENTTLDPTQYTQYNPGGKPQFTGKDLDPNQISVGSDPHTDQIVINFEMQGSAIARFGDFTGKHIGDQLTITLDRKVIASAIINSAIDGPFEIPADFAQQQISAIVSVLKYGPLPVEL